MIKVPQFLGSSHGYISVSRVAGKYRRLLETSYRSWLLDEESLRVDEGKRPLKQSWWRMFWGSATWRVSCVTLTIYRQRVFCTVRNVSPKTFTKLTRDAVISGTTLPVKYNLYVSIVQSLICNINLYQSKTFRLPLKLPHTREPLPDNYYCKEKKWKAR